MEGHRLSRPPPPAPGLGKLRVGLPAPQSLWRGCVDGVRQGSDAVLCPPPGVRVWSCLRGLSGPGPPVRAEARPRSLRVWLPVPPHGGDRGSSPAQTLGRVQTTRRPRESTRCRRRPGQRPGRGAGPGARTPSLCAASLCTFMSGDPGASITNPWAGDGQPRPGHAPSPARATPPGRAAVPTTLRDVEKVPGRAPVRPGQAQGQLPS